MMLRLYTQNNCRYCTVMMNKLAEWGLAFDVINISNNAHAKQFLKEQGHRTVPQLYLDNFNVNEGIETEEFTERMFYDRLDVLLETRSPAEVQHILEKYDANKGIS